MAVISLKNVIKYFIKIAIAMTIIVAFIQYSSHKKTHIKQSEILGDTSFLSCLDTTIPGIADRNYEERKEIETNPRRKKKV